MYLFLPCVLDGINEDIDLVKWLLVESQFVQLVCHIFLLNHETHEEIFVRQFFLIAVGDKAVEHVVMFHSRMAADRLEAAVVVGEYQAVR